MSIKVDYYQLLRPILFSFDAETAHTFSLKALKVFNKFVKVENFHSPVSLANLTFPNRLGLAAGLDKNGDYIDALAHLGFGFIEVGAVTPKPQTGNPKPRLFRIPEANALINRMGFNNKGVDHLVAQLKIRQSKKLVGVNIGKNFITALTDAAQDYCDCLEKVFPYADYVSVNISSPNTPGLRELQNKNYLSHLLQELKNKQQQLGAVYNKLTPLFLKITVDLSSSQIEELIDLVLNYKIEGLIISNTTIDHRATEAFKHGKEAGGVSGQPLFQKSLATVKLVNERTAYKLPIIAVGGIFSGQDAVAMLDAGASLVQIYTGLIYKGPKLIKDILKAIDNAPSG